MTDLEPKRAMISFNSLGAEALGLADDLSADLGTRRGFALKYLIP